MIIFFLSVALVADHVASIRIASAYCSQPTDLLPCNILFKVIERDGLFSISKQTLENDCPKLLDSFRCLEDHWTICIPFAVQDVVKYMSCFKSILEELCDSDSELRKKYEKHVPCLTYSSRELQNCTSAAKRKVSSLLMNTSENKLLSVNTYRCLTHIELLICVRNVSKNTCGASASRLLGRPFERAIRPYRRMNCNLSEHFTGPSRKEDYERLLKSQFI